MKKFPAVLCAIILHASSTSAQEPSRTTLGGYGEIHYSDPDGSRQGRIDFQRFVLYLAHAFTDRITLRSEVELEHTRVEAGNPNGGELALEQAYLDFRIAESFGIRAGLVLIPVGLINLSHDPPSLNGVERPAVEGVIIPTTGREAGAGVYGAPLDGVRYQLYLTAGLDAAGFDAAEGIREGRQEGFESTTANPSLSGRIDYTPVNGLALGASFFAGHANAGVDSIGRAAVGLWSADARFTTGPFAFRGLVAAAAIGDAGLINGRYGENVADRIYGYYLEGAWNILPLIAPDTEEDLSLFLRYERYDTQSSTTGFTPLAQYNRNDIVVGATYKPAFNVALKANYLWNRNALNAGDARNSGQFSMGFGYAF